MQALASEGYGKIISREQMIQDKYLAYNQCCTMYMKPHPDLVDKNFLKMAKDDDITHTFYTSCFNKKVEDPTVKKILSKYHPNLDMMYLSLSSVEDDSHDSSSGKYNITVQYLSMRYIITT